MQSWVIDPASLEVNRRKRRAKTDRLDVEKIYRSLVRHDRGEVVRLKNIVLGVDPKAFFSSGDAGEVIGEGFAGAAE